MRLLLVLTFLGIAAPALANHPGERLNEVMVKKEPAFETSDRLDIPSVNFLREDGTGFGLEDMKGHIVVVSFVPETCGAPCSDQQALVGKVQESIDITPMREMVKFVTVTAEPVVSEGKRGSNWITARPNGENSVAAIAGTFASLSARGGNEPMVHIIDRGGRHAALFHGAEIGHINMVLYINGLTNAHPHEPNLLERFLGMFR